MIQYCKYHIKKPSVKIFRCNVLFAVCAQMMNGYRSFASIKCALVMKIMVDVKAKKHTSKLKKLAWINTQNKHRINTFDCSKAVQVRRSGIIDLYFSFENALFYAVYASHDVYDSC